MLKGKKILLGVTGSIAAYKSAVLVRLLVKAGADVQVVMSPDAGEFITPLTLATLSKRPVLSDFVADYQAGTWNNHVDLGLWADLMLVAPATANTMAKMANGQSDNLLLGVYLSARCPVWVAPAMDLDMFAHESTQSNLRQLQSNGNRVIEPDSGELASGLEGKGRMAEPEAIVELLAQHFTQSGPLLGKRVVITAGPTHEPIDPVRYIGNRSSGKMGFALAEAAASLGASVLLITGPTTQVIDVSGVERTDVETAEQMYQATTKAFAHADIAIMSAAVADYRPKQVASTKIKKKDAELVLELEPTKDILKSLGEQKQAGQFLVGFALETDDEEANAKSKLERKNLDMIVLNSLRDPGAGFQGDTNKITILGKDNKIASFELKSKRDVARDIFKEIIERSNA